MYVYYYNNLMVWQILVLPVNVVHYCYYYLLTPTTTGSIA